MACISFLSFASRSDGAAWQRPIAGLHGVETSFKTRRLTLGYREADCALGAERAPWWLRIPFATGDDDPFAFVRDVYGSPEAKAGSRRGLATGSFFHVIAEA
jgi:cobyrinic acid a,c-diamide synthase